MIFILDNFDSFTYNLYQYFGEIGETVVVRRRDVFSLAEIEELSPELIVISPGPCSPTEAQLSLDVIHTFQGRIPILGVCLGHQAIGQALGGKVIRAKIPVHGKTSMIRHDGLGVFRGLSNPLKVTRYHSLALDRSTLPPCLQISAETDDGEIMAIRHRELPIEGVQFHPEAILTEEGHELLRNAITDARVWHRKQQKTSPWIVRPFTSSLTPTSLLKAFQDAPLPFFLDSGNDYPRLGQFSFLSAFPFLRVTAQKDKLEISWPDTNRNETHPLNDWTGLDVLDTLFQTYHVPIHAPFPFAGGAVGFFSYDLKDALEKMPQKGIDDLTLPYWSFAWYDGILIYDHAKESYFLTACGIQKNGECSAILAKERLDRLAFLLENYLSISHGTTLETIEISKQSNEVSPISPEVTKNRYLADLQKVIDYIFAGDIYQANLSQRFSLAWDGDPWLLYSRLREKNPAPFAAFLPYDDFQLLCSSPERFIRIDPNSTIETRPIKGTRPRGSSPEEDEALAVELQQSIKDQAELTMIVDLERNDLGHICSFGTVRVPSLIELEKYPTVWHLVSTVTGKLRENLLPSEIIKAIFPGGSITGAPKLRAMEIIEELEPFKRGIYTGSIGYLGFDGAWDLNIVIRTIVLKQGIAYVHAGGGIVADSIPSLEYEETLHKAAALFSSLGTRIHE